jgi:hypothetical protein
MIDPSGLRKMVHNGLELYLANKFVDAQLKLQEMQIEYWKYEIGTSTTKPTRSGRGSLEEIEGFVNADEKIVAYYDNASDNRESWLASQTEDAFSYWSIPKIDTNPRQASGAICDYAVMLFTVAGLWTNDGVQKRQQLYRQIEPNLRRYVHATSPVDVGGMYGQMGVIWNEFEQNNHTINTVSCEDAIVTAIMCSLYSGR